MLRIGAPELALLIGTLVCVLLVALVVVAVVAVVGWRVMRGRPSPAAREEALESLGYRRAGSAWSRGLYGTSVTFEETRGWRWTVRLPRYNTLTLHVEERDSGRVPEGKVFVTENPALDARFVMGAERSAQSVALVSNRAVGNAMLAMPWLSVRLRADELLIEDPDLRGLAKLAGGPAAPGTQKSIAAECKVHDAVAGLVTAIFDSLYSKHTGTIMPEHR